MKPTHNHNTFGLYIFSELKAVLSRHDNTALGDGPGILAVCRHILYIPGTAEKVPPTLGTAQNVLPTLLLVHIDQKASPTLDTAQTIPDFLYVFYAFRMIRLPYFVFFLFRSKLSR